MRIEIYLHFSLHFHARCRSHFLSFRFSATSSLTFGSLISIDTINFIRKRCTRLKLYLNARSVFGYFF